MSKRVITFGEIMLRLAPNGYYRFFQDDQLQATFGGGEANVAVSLANYGIDAAFVTKLPAHAIGQGAVNTLRGLGVDTSKIVRGGERVGIYFLERALRSAAASPFMTAPIPPFRRRSPPTLTGTPSLKGPTGSTLPASHRRWGRILCRSVLRPARLPGPRASPCRAI